MPKFKDVAHGHHHQNSIVPLDGDACVHGAGAVENSNVYAVKVCNGLTSPSQRMLFVDPAKGEVSIQRKVSLEEPDEDKGAGSAGTKKKKKKKKKAKKKNPKRLKKSATR